MRAVWAMVFLALAGCGTVTQAPVAPQTQGVEKPAQKVNGGYLWGTIQHDRYNALIALYGHSKYANGVPIFVPALRKDDGTYLVSKGVWFWTDEAMVDFDLLSRLKHQAFPP